MTNEDDLKEMGEIADKTLSGQQEVQESADGLSTPSDGLADAIREYNKACESTLSNVYSVVKDKSITYIAGGGAVYTGIETLVSTFRPVMAGLDKTAAKELKTAMRGHNVTNIPAHMRSVYMLDGDGAKYLREQMIDKGLDESLVSSPVRWDHYLAEEITSLNNELTKLRDHPKKAETHVANRISELENMVEKKEAQKKILDSLPDKTTIPSVISVVDGDKMKAAAELKVDLPEVNVEDVFKATEKLDLDKKVEASYKSVHVDPATLRKSKSGSIEMKKMRKTKSAGIAIKRSVKSLWKDVILHPREFLKRHRTGTIITVAGGALVYDFGEDISSAVDYMFSDDVTQSGVMLISDAQLDELRKNYKKLGLTEEEYNIFKENVTGGVKIDEQVYKNVNKKMQEAYPDKRASVQTENKGLVATLQSAEKGAVSNPVLLNNTRTGRA